MENPNEVKEIRNKLRMMGFPQDEIVSCVRRQQRAISKQSQANETIKNEIAQYEREIAHIDKTVEEFKTNEELQKLNSLQKIYQNKLSVINADLAAEEQKRKKLEEEVSKANSKHGGFYKQSKENQELQARLRTMENRLDKALLRYNANLQKLADQRHRIDELRKNRFTFRDVMRKQEKERQERDSQMAELISTSNQAYSERDRMKMDLVTLKQAEKEDIKNFDEEYSRLTQQIEGQRITQSRPRDQQQAVPSLNSQLGSQSDQQEELTQQTDQLQEIITQTINLCGFDSHEELIRAADQIEQENFSLYNFVVEHGSQKSKLQDEIDLLQLQHTKLLQQIESNDSEQKDDLEDLTENIKHADEDLVEIKEQEAKNKSEFQAVYEEIGNLFNTLECSWDNAPDESQTVSPSNAMFCLSQIENAMAEMMGNVAEKVKYMYSMRGITDYSTILTSEQQEAAAQKIAHARAMETKEAPKLPEMSKPLTLEEMMQMLNT